MEKLKSTSMPKSQIRTRISLSSPHFFGFSPSYSTMHSARRPLWRNRSAIFMVILVIVFFCAFIMIDVFTVIRALPVYDHSSELSVLRAQLKAQEDELVIFQTILDDLAEQNRKLHDIVEQNAFQPLIDEKETGFTRMDRKVRNVYFDLGANRGDTTLQFVGLSEENGLGGVYARQLFGIPARIAGEWDIRIYEVNPVFDEELKKLKDRVRQLDRSIYGGPFNVYLFTTTAIGTKEGVADIFIDGKSDPKWGSSLLKDHPDANGTTIQVPMHDLTKEIVGNYKIEDYVILKIDIEGSEIDLLMDLLLRGVFPYIDELYVEFHGFADKNNILPCLSLILSFAENYMRVGKWQ
eukprot:Phypoly_transcript_09794.p1 GENE.Phypoly_transcript_09794~~Phypoly_transcript_09794.p1  ORF type:complete len:351 (+),score=50.11 Phypoly_transcript_09794:153-1205(+)